MHTFSKPSDNCLCILVSIQYWKYTLFTQPVVLAEQDLKKSKSYYFTGFFVVEIRENWIWKKLDKYLSSTTNQRISIDRNGVGGEWIASSMNYKQGGKGREDDWNKGEIKKKQSLWQLVLSSLQKTSGWLMMDERKLLNLMLKPFCFLDYMSCFYAAKPFLW